MKGKKVLAGIMVGSMLTIATTGLAAATEAPTGRPEEPQATSESSWDPTGVVFEESTAPETAMPVAVPSGEPVAISDESGAPIDETEGSVVPISDESAAPIGEPEGSAVPISDESADPVDPEGSAVPISDTSASPGGASTAEPVAIDTAPTTTGPQITLTDLAQVAAYVLGKGDLTPEQERTFDLDGNGEITLTDLTQMASIYEESLNPAPSLPIADEEHATSRFRGTISEIDANEHTIWIRSSAEGEEANIVGAVFDDDTMFVDCVSGDMVRTAALAEGDSVVAYLDTHLMLSEPPKAACPALVTNVPTEFGQADYVYVTEVRDGSNGSVVVFNQNADLYVTIPADLEIGVYGSELTGEPSTASLSDIKVGSKLIVWYDVVLESYPAQTTALRCLIDLDD